MAGANYMGEVAPADGTYIGYFSSVPWIYAIALNQRRIAFDQFDFVALQPGTAIHYMRTDVKPGIKSVDQILSAENLIVGGLSRDNAKDVMMRLALDMLGVPYKYVTAYPGSQGVRMALERGEVNYYAESPAVYRTAIEPLVQAGEVIPLYYDPGYDGQSFSVPKQVQGLQIPSFLEIYRKLKGAEPTGVRWESYLAALSVNNATQRLVVCRRIRRQRLWPLCNRLSAKCRTILSISAMPRKCLDMFPNTSPTLAPTSAFARCSMSSPRCRSSSENYIADR